MNYVDTSVLISAMDTSVRPRSRQATTLLANTREKVVSELFLVELSASISRKPELISAVPAEDAQPSTIILAYLVYLMSKYDLKLLPLSGEQVATPFGKVGAESGSCLALASEVKLRSLDLLHVAHLISLKNGGFNIEALLTSDSDFSKVQRFLKEHQVELILLGSQ